MNKLGKERLLKLAWLLENLATEFNIKRPKFDMRFWAEDKSCGTAACACGWAARHPWFKRRGFKLGPREIFGPRGLSLTFKDYTAHGATRRFFDITTQQSDRLFAPNGGAPYDKTNPGPETVASAIREFVAAQ